VIFVVARGDAACPAGSLSDGAGRSSGLRHTVIIGLLRRVLRAMRRAARPRRHPARRCSRSVPCAGLSLARTRTRWSLFQLRRLSQTPPTEPVARPCPDAGSVPERGANDEAREPSCVQRRHRTRCVQ
jgi:hypothetical protein